MPDGEVGPRRHWISRVHYQVLAAHPELDVVQRPAPDENGVERQSPRNAADAWWFKVKDGVKEVRFGDPGWRLGYARDAINSYFVFKTMKEKGVLPRTCASRCRSRWSTACCRRGSFPTCAISIRSGRATRRRRGPRSPPSSRRFPHKDLAIQWDCSTEIQDAYGACRAPARRCDRAQSAEVRNLSPHIPSEVALGYHFCFGTLGGWPRFAPDDLGQAVKLANGFVAASGRRVDWVHIPVLDRSDDAFFAPLKELRPQGARVYLGAIHNMARFKERLATARKYLPDFGLGAYCGFGRLPPAELPGVLANHVEAAEIAGLH